MDDGSTDSTAAIAASYEERLRYVRQPENRGQFGNVNDGIALARGELIGLSRRRHLHAGADRAGSRLAAGASYGRRGLLLRRLHRRDGREFGRLVLPAEIAGGQPLGYASILNALLVHGNSFYAARRRS